MKVDIDQLTEPELVDLNHRVVERLRFLQQMRGNCSRSPSGSSISGCRLRGELR